MIARFALALAVAPALTQAQTIDSTALKSAAEWIRLIAPPGAEEQVAATLAKNLGDGWQVDRFGNLVKRVGSGTPRRVVACGIDFSAYVVSQITEKGYIRVRRTGTAGHQLWDQFHEAQRVAVVTRNGRVPGVVAVANGHFAQQHRADTLPATMDDLWIDIGASSTDDVARAGVSLLDPLTIDRPAWTFADVAAGPAAGARAGCAAIVAVSTGQVSGGETHFVVSAQRSYNWLGLNRFLTTVGRVQSLAFVNDGVDESAAGARGGGGAGRGGRGGAGGGGRGAGIPSRATVADSTQPITPRVRYARTLVESIDAGALQSVFARVLDLAGVSAATVKSWPAPGLDTARVLTRRPGVEGEIERQWMAIADLPGVAGHEHQVRAAVLAALPAWARTRAVVDSIGNVIVAMGPERDSVAYIAHMDEVGFEVASVMADGRVALRNRGGAVIPSWEGTPALQRLRSGESSFPGIRDGYVRRGLLPSGSDSTRRSSWRAAFGKGSVSRRTREPTGCSDPASPDGRATIAPARPRCCSRSVASIPTR